MILFLVADNLTRFLAYPALWLCAWFLIWGMRTAENRRRAQAVAAEAWANMVSAWVNDDREGRDPLLSLQDLTPYVGEVLPRAEPAVDELGEWFPERHATVPPHLYVGLSYVFPVSRGYDEDPWWLSSTGAWKTVAPKRLEASQS